MKDQLELTIKIKFTFAGNITYIKKMYLDLLIKNHQRVTKKKIFNKLYYQIQAVACEEINLFRYIMHEGDSNMSF